MSTVHGWLVSLIGASLAAAVALPAAPLPLAEPSGEVPEPPSAFVSLMEVPDRGPARTLPATRQVQEVDINSVVEVQFHPQAFGLGGTGILESEASRRLRRELSLLQQQLTRAETELRELSSSLGPLRSRALASGSPQDELEFRQALATQADVVLPIILGLVESLGRTATDRALGEPGYDALIALLVDHIEDVQRRLRLETQRLLDETEAIINAWCLHSSRAQQPTAIHLRNYDTLAAGQLSLIPKVTFSRSPEEDRHLRESVAFHDSIRRLLEDIGDEESSLRRLLADVEGELLSTLEAVETLFGDELRALLEDVREAAEETGAPAGLRAFAEQLEELEPFLDLEAQHLELVKSLQETNVTDPISVLDLFLGRVEDFQKKAGALLNRERLEELAEQIEALAGIVVANLQQLPAELRARAETVAEAGLERAAEQLQRIEAIVGNSEALRDLVNGLKTLGGSAKLAREIEEIDAGSLAPAERLNVALSQAPSTTIDIPRTNRRERDQYELVVQVKRGEDTVLHEERHAFRVRKLGWHSRWTGNLVFAQHQDESSFQPATSVSWLLHHRSRPTDNRGGRGILGNLVDLGLGFHSAVFAVDSDVEFGLGVGVSLFRDVVQLGYGVNLQREQDEGYFYVGASLFDVLRPVNRGADVPEP